MQRLPLKQILFRGDERLYHDLYFGCIFIDLRNDRQSHGIHGNPRENGFPWSCSDMYFASIPYHLQKVLPINRPFFSQPFCLVKQQEVVVRDKKKTAAWETNSLRAQLVIVSSRKVPPHKQAKEALRNKTKSCCTGLTCRHNDTKSWYCYKGLLLTIW